jgi:tRNA pseudouridine38-40 synthase
MLSDMPLNSRYALEFAYHGSYFHGWQIQPNAKTVQESINEALSLILGKEINVVGAGRTDTGVHASHFIAHFDWHESSLDTDLLAHKLNSFLKNPIRIGRIVNVHPDFHSRFSAVKRTYHYLISLDQNPFLCEFSWFINKSLNLDEMIAASVYLIGKKDFTCFSKLHTDTKTNDCDITSADWSEQSGCLIFRISADRFLRNMVRAIVGTLVEVGLGKRSPHSIPELIAGKDRSEAGQSAPAQGLFLTRIDYPEELLHVNPLTLFPHLI